ncbi:MAG: YceI family protein [Flavobacteriales bacterium]
MKIRIAFLTSFAAMILAACSENSNSANADGTAASGAGQATAYDACSCVNYKDSESPEYAKCKELRKADPKFEADFQQCTLAAISGSDTNSIKLKTAERIAKNQASVSGMYMVTPGKSKVVWRGEKATGKTHKGTIDVKEGKIELSNSVLQGGSISLDMTTLKVTDEDAGTTSKLEQHLKSADFFDVAKHSTAKFEITKVSAVNYNTFTAEGNLSIKGISKKATANIVMNAQEGYTTFGGSISFDRAEFDVRFGSDNFFQNLGDDLIKDQIVLTFDLVAVK